MVAEKSDFRNQIKIYSDGADRDSMLAMEQDPMIQGMTTNPSLMKKAGVKDYRSFCKEILSFIKKKPISFEVFADDLSEMERQALEIMSWGKNVYVKIPVINSEGKSSLPLVEKLTHQGVKLNITAVLTLKQVIQVSEALKGGSPSIVSIFAGRIADTGRDPAPLMKAAVEICRAVESPIEVLWASVREVFNVMEAERCGCDIVTVPFDIISKLSLLHKDLDQVSLDTVRTFKKDAESAGFSL